MRNCFPSTMQEREKVQRLFLRLVLWGGVALLVLIPLFSTITPVASSAIQVCPNTVVSIKAQEPVDYREICLGADDALKFFANLGMEPTAPIVVEIVKKISNLLSETAVGCYLEKENRVIVLAFSEFQKKETWFKMPIERSMYRSLVTHEVAHAVSDCNFSTPDPTIQAKEYIAYVVMFATMGSNLRERILIANPGEGFDSELKINTIIYLCDPIRFGVEAYRHYLKKEHGTAFLLDVLSGKALAN